MILEKLTVGPFQENCYVIGDGETGIGALVDPGDEAARIAMAVEQTGLDIGSIIVTHAHIDHVGAVADLVDDDLQGAPALLAYLALEPRVIRLEHVALRDASFYGLLFFPHGADSRERGPRIAVYL